MLDLVFNITLPYSQERDMNGNYVNDDVNTNISSIVSAGNGEVDDVLVGGGKQGDKKKAEDEEDPPETGIGSVPHFGTRFT